VIQLRRSWRGREGCVWSAHAHANHCARSFIPMAGGLEDTQVALHEIYCRTYYWLRALVFGTAI
jgi:hypothetical protein